MWEMGQREREEEKGKKEREKRIGRMEKEWGVREEIHDKQRNQWEPR